ncbi:MAG: HAMP domain-containing sensor histidine kinase [Chloroflexota bacterium]
MAWYQRLRFRLIASQIAVVVAGAGAMLVVFRLLIPGRIAIILDNLLTRLNLSADLNGQLLPELNQAISRLLVGSVGLAAVIAFLVGVGFSMLVWSSIITPIRKMAQSSQRIADGRYDERVELPNRAGEAITQLAINFNQMAQTLESVEEQRIRLMGNVTHELRTPLSSLSGYVEGLGDGVFEPNEKLVGSMKKQIDRMARLIDETQALSQAESRIIQLSLEAVNVADAINQVIYQLTPQALAKEHTVAFAEPEQDVYVSADYDRLIQILLNLNSNAISYTPPRGNIDFSLSVEAKTCIIQIKDSGIGIPADKLPFIFERFYRVDSSRSQKHGGSGVGLTISRNLARQMNGDLLAMSNGEKTGSIFQLILPLAP